jgi:hypothetical protein
MDRYYPFDRVPPVGAAYTHVTTDRKHLLMCQTNTSAVSTVGDDYGGISTTDVVLPSSACGQLAQSSFMSVSVLVVTKKSQMEVRRSFERTVLNTIHIYKIRQVNNYGLLKNDAGLNSECVVT